MTNLKKLNASYDPQSRPQIHPQHHLVVLLYKPDFKLCFFIVI